MQTFVEFVDKKVREAKKQLNIIFKLLEMQDLKVTNHTNSEDPYIFLFSPKSLTFDGIRIYKIGDQIAFRIQKQEDTHPFGRAYPINIEDMFEDLMSDQHNAEKAAKEVAKAVVSEVKRFFDKSVEAERELRAVEFDPADPFGKVIMRGAQGDYSNTIYS